MANKDENINLTCHVKYENTLRKDIEMQTGVRQGCVFAQFWQVNTYYYIYERWTSLRNNTQSEKL